MSVQIFKVNEIFHSLQGEGFNSGRPVTFIRLADCNLNCTWCDTDFDTYNILTLDEICTIVKGFALDSIVITGGEPTIHKNLLNLVHALKQSGYWVALETNGVNGLPDELHKLFDYISVSPKFFYQQLYRKTTSLGRADEVRIVVDGQIAEFCRFVETRITAANYYLSPCCHFDGNFNLLETMELLGKLNMRKEGKDWRLSLQLHKFANIQ